MPRKEHTIYVITDDGKGFPFEFLTYYPTNDKSEIISAFLDRKYLYNKKTEYYYPMHRVVKFTLLGVGLK